MMDFEGIQTVRISIHAPREGGDPSPARTRSPSPPISIHAPREGGDFGAVVDGVDVGISIHAPREGGDVGQLSFVRLKGISIHAPREGGDCAGCSPSPPGGNFNPRPPRGGRPQRHGRRQL